MNLEEHKQLAVLLESLRLECMEKTKDIRFKKDHAKSIYTKTIKQIDKTKHILDEISHKEFNLTSSIYYGALRK